MKYKKSYKFAFYTSFLLTILIVFILGLLSEKITLTFWQKALFIFGFFLGSFLIIQFRVENFIYKRIQKIYQEVSLLDEAFFNKNTITSNMESLSKNVKLYAENKRLEIENLTERESYRREFLGNISHELKTPLFTVQGYILTLLEGAIDDKEIRLKYLERANNGVERLNHIVKDLDLISKLETGDLNLSLSSFDILELIKEVFELLEIKANKKSINLSFDKVYEGKIFVSADKDRIQQVLLNLIANAINYGKNNGFVKIVVKAHSTNKILIEIIDNGIGIAEEDKNRIFERFYRTEKSRSRNQGGTGLGLSIVKHIIDAHNEQINVESSFNLGSNFSFTLKQP